MHQSFEGISTPLWVALGISILIFIIVLISFFKKSDTPPSPPPPKDIVTISKLVYGINAITTNSFTISNGTDAITAWFNLSGASNFTDLQVSFLLQRNGETICTTATVDVHTSTDDDFTYLTYMIDEGGPGLGPSFNHACPSIPLEVGDKVLFQISGNSDKGKFTSIDKTGLTVQA